MTKKEKLKEIERKVNLLFDQKHGAEIDELKEQLGYYHGHFFSRPWISPNPTIAKTIDLILDHLGLKVGKQEEKYMLIKKKQPRLRTRKAK